MPLQENGRHAEVVKLGRVLHASCQCCSLDERDAVDARAENFEWFHAEAPLDSAGYGLNWREPRDCAPGFQ